MTGYSLISRVGQFWISTQIHVVAEDLIHRFLGWSPTPQTVSAFSYLRASSIHVWWDEELCGLHLGKAPHHNQRHEHNPEAHLRRFS